jgi:hypothetical protein
MKPKILSKFFAWITYGIILSKIVEGVSLFDIIEEKTSP